MFDLSSRPRSGNGQPAREIRRRMALVAARFESPHDGERLAALEAFGRLLHAAGLSWPDLIDRLAQGGTGEGGDPSHREIVEALAREAGDALTPWECSFLDGCTTFQRLSEKQWRTLANIRTRVEAAREAWGAP